MWYCFGSLPESALFQQPPECLASVLHDVPATRRLGELLAQITRSVWPSLLSTRRSIELVQRIQR